MEEVSVFFKIQEYILFMNDRIRSGPLSSYTGVINKLMSWRYKY